ncbi:MAG: hypothetical protein LBL92_03675 [Propionibacteriaceae bacterium]|jgi:predicted transcriptional regulator of viral defense system|nr:hypothetical protein [Propionibacteriaceae bacterium]
MNHSESTLPSAFTFTEACRIIGERQLRNLIQNGKIVPIARGLYRRSDWLGDEDLVEISRKANHATICLRSALARHDLIDDIPTAIDVAIPRGRWAPKVTPPVTWHHFDKRTFSLGREEVAVDSEITIGLYSAERSIIDVYRLQRREGADMAHEALKRWLRRGGQPSILLEMATHFPKALPVLRSTLEVLL